MSDKAKVFLLVVAAGVFALAAYPVVIWLVGPRDPELTHVYGGICMLSWIALGCAGMAWMDAPRRRP